jgi:alpha-tubulin suppressor-like RCC1 family protein
VNGGCLGHGDTVRQMFPCRVQAFDEDNIRVLQMSAGVDMSMAVSTSGDVYAWGMTDGGRIGLGLASSSVTLPRRINLISPDPDNPTTQVPIKAVDVECGYVHSLIVGLNGTLHIRKSGRSTASTR